MKTLIKVFIVFFIDVINIDVKQKAAYIRSLYLLITLMMN